MDTKETVGMEPNGQNQEKDKKSEKSEKSKKSKKKWLLLLLLLLIVLGFGGCYAYRYFTMEAPLNAMQKELDAEIGIMPGMTDDEIQDRLNRHVEEGRFNVSMNGTPTFKNGTAKGNVNIENIPGNRYALTVTITVMNVDTVNFPAAAPYVGQDVLKTGLMEPGTYLSDKQLDVDLPAGVYDCIARFTAYTAEKNANGGEQKEVGASQMQIVLTVQE